MNSNIIYTETSKVGLHFNEWLVGFTEGDGNFSIRANESISGFNYVYVYSLTQSNYNLGLLEFIRNILCTGRMTNMYGAGAFVIIML